MQYKKAVNKYREDRNIGSLLKLLVLNTLFFNKSLSTKKKNCIKLTKMLINNVLIDNYFFLHLKHRIG